MAIQTDTSLLGDVNQTIQTTANLNQGAQTAAAANQAGGLLGGIGNNWSTKYGAAYGKERAIQQISEQLDKGVNGDYSHIANFTPYGEAYNQLMDQVAPNVLSTQMSQALQLRSNQIRTDPHITADKKVQAVSEAASMVLTEGMKHVPEEYQSQVKMNVGLQGLEEQQKMIKIVAEVQTAQQFLGVKDSLEQSKQLAASANNVESAMSNYQIFKSNADAMLAAGAINLQQHQSIIDDGKSTIALAQIGTHGYDALKKWNDSSKLFNEQEMQQFQHMNDVIYQQKQHAIVLEQTRQGISFENDMLGYLDGSVKTMPDYVVSDEQAIVKKSGAMARNLYQAARTMGESQQKQLVASAAFNSLPSQWQSMIRSNLAEIKHKRATGDLTEYGMDENTPFDVRLAKAQEFGISPDKLLTKKEQNQLRVAFINGDRQATYKALAAKTNPQFADYYTKKFAGDPDNPMPAMLNPYAKTDSAYMMGSNAKGVSGVKPTAKNAPTMYRAMQIEGIPTATKIAMFDHIQQASKGNPMATPEELTNERYGFTPNGNGFVIKSHVNKFNTENAKKIATQTTKDKQQQIQIQEAIEKGVIYPNFESNLYVVDKKGGLSFGIPFSQVDQLPDGNVDWRKSVSTQRHAAYLDNVLKTPGRLLGLDNTTGDEE